MSRISLVCPFHVKHALGNIAKLRGHVDLLITVSDARSPSATDLSGDIISQFVRSGVKTLSLISKGDLSDLTLPNTFNFKSQSSRNPILRLIKQALGADKFRSKNYRPHLQVLIAGFPNTGKSTLINLLKGKRVAISENLPGKTKRISRFPIGDNIWVYDTPGILTFRHSKDAIAHRLFLLNCIPTPLKNPSEILEPAYLYLLKHYTKDLTQFLSQNPPLDYASFLAQLAQKFKFMRNRGQWDLERAENKFLNILWSGGIKLNWDRDA